MSRLGLGFSRTTNFRSIVSISRADGTVRNRYSQACSACRFPSVLGLQAPLSERTAVLLPGKNYLLRILLPARYHTLRLRTMLDLVKVARSKNVLNPAWVDTLMLSWVTSSCEAWQRLLAALHGLAGEIRGSSQLGEISRVRKGPRPADLLDELGRVARFTVRRALLIVQAFSRHSAVGLESSQST